MDESMQAALVLSAVSLASLERDVDKQLIAFVVESLSDFEPKAASLDSTLSNLLSHKLLAIRNDLYAVTDPGMTILNNCNTASSSQREWLESIAATLQANYAGL